jgi:uncharacterized membrane protein YhaH (DUF805 family)
MPELVNIVQVIFAIAGIALTVKRLHDLDKSGWWILAPYGLLIFGIIILIAGGDHVVTAAISLLIMIPALLFQPALFFWPGTRGPNRFGPDQRLYRQTNMLPAE